MQKNMNTLPVNSFSEIEDIMDPWSTTERNGDINPSAPSKVVAQGRKMAETYKRMREIEERNTAQHPDDGLNTLIAKYVSAKPMYTQH